MTEMKKPMRLGSPEYQAVYDNILHYFNGDQLAADVLIGKYLHRDNEFLYETSPEDLFNRLTDEFYRIEQKYPNPLSRAEIYDMFKDFRKCVLGGSALSGIGNGGYVSFSNCYVIGNDADSYGGIFKTDEEQTQLHKRRGGCGHDISHLRPANAAVQNSAITSSGGASFMERYSESTRSVAQNGRRGATILTCFNKKTLTLTDKGWERIIDTVNAIRNGETRQAWTDTGYHDIIDTQIIENVQTYEVTLENGKVITVTGDHKFVVHNIQTDEEYLKPLIDIDCDIEELICYT